MLLLGPDRWLTSLNTKFESFEMPHMTGSCLCGGLRYDLTADLIFSAICHCKTCQKQTGTAFRVVVAVPRPAVTVEGASNEDRGQRTTSPQPVLPRLRV